MKNKKKLCITIVVCLVVGIISGIAYFQVGKAAKKDNSQVVNESTTTKKDKGKTGKSLLNEINIKSYKDISKIVVGKNTQEDVSWVEPIQTITFTCECYCLNWFYPGYIFLCIFTYNNF